MKVHSDRILVVDDDENILFLLTRSLERNGYSVVSTTDGLNALELLKSGERFAVLLTDLMMPEINGLDLLQAARAIDPWMESVVITAAGSVESAIAALRDGHAWDYLLKPLESFQQVNAVIQRAVAHRALLMERAALQEQVAAEAERLRTLVDSVSEAILAASNANVITVANPAAQRLLVRFDLIGAPVRDALPPRLLGLIDNWQVVGSQFPATLEITWNTTTTLMVSLTPLPDKSGGRGWVMALRDITALKQQEKVKTQALAEVVGRIRLLLAEAMNALVEINLRAPQDDRITASLFRLTRVWENIQTWGDELLSVAQADAARAPHPASVDLAAMIKKLPEDAAVRRYQMGGGLFEVRVDGALPPVHTDPEMISAALLSLVRRSILRGPANNEIQVSARAHNQTVWIEISDNGPPAEDTSPVRGVDQSINRLVNDPANTSATVGLELVRARTILDRLEGQLWIGGRGPRGSTIQFCLPPSLVGGQEATRVSR